MKGKLKYKQELELSNEKEMSMKYFLSEGKRQKCKEMNLDWQMFTCRNCVHSTTEHEILSSRT